jgi:hypothetical protein
MYWNILTIHVPMNVKSPNNTSKWQMGFNSAFKGLKVYYRAFYKHNGIISMKLKLIPFLNLTFMGSCIVRIF